MELCQLPPGFRFSPTDEELLMHYLKNRACGKDCPVGLIADVDVYKHEPWDLREKSALPSADSQWYFFDTLSQRHSHSSRIKRTTSKGYWKSTGKDRRICSGPQTVGMKKTLIYYDGRAPSGKRTDWIMHEYKLDEDYEKKNKVICSPVLCRVRKKGGPGPMNGEQYGAPVHDETNEWVEDADGTADESVHLASPQRLQVPSNLSQPDTGEPEADFHNEFCTAGRGLDDSVGDNTDFARVLEYLLEDFAASSPETGIVSSIVAVDRTQNELISSKSNVGSRLCTPWDQEKKIAIVHDHLQPFTSEEGILNELLHVAETSLAGPSYMDVPDGFVEMDDLDSPFHDLDSLFYDFETGYPDDYGIKRHQISPELCDKETGFGCPPDLLNAQGLANRRIRLQVNPQSCVIETAFESKGPIQKMASEVPGSIGISVQVENIGPNPSQPGERSICSIDLDSDSTAASRMPLPTRQSGKESQVVKTSDNLKKMTVGPVISDLVIFTPSLVRNAGCLIEGLDCKGRGGLLASAAAGSHGSHRQIESSDCEAGPCSRFVPGESSNLVNVPSHEGNKDVGELTNKLKAVNLRSCLIELESNLSTTFNEKVFALGKPVARLFPANNAVDPYRTLKSGLMGSLCRLGLVVLWFLFIFLAANILTRFVSFFSA